MEEQFVIFSLGKEEYAVSISQVREIIQYNGATKLPQTPKFVEGIINLRGKVIPVINLAERFELKTDEINSKKAVIVDTNGKEIGMIVDEVTDVIRISSESIEPAPSIMSINNHFIRGVGKRDNRLLILLDLDQLFTYEEFSQLKEKEN